MSTIEHPYANLPTGGAWLRGNLHTHSNRSDGAHEAQFVLDAYAAAGYDFLMLSDHDIYTSPDDLAALDRQGMVLIPGNEISRGGVHMLHVNPDRLIPAHENRQQVIDEIAASQGFCVVNHPNWLKRFDHCPHEKMAAWNGFAGLEIYNGVIGRLEGSPYATDHWDMLLAAGRRVWGFANDDSHDHAQGDCGLGWNMVYTDTRSPEAITNALAAGQFYASTGVTITKIEVDGMRIRIETENAQRIVALRAVASRLAVVDAKVIEVDVPDGARVVRFECWGAGESRAWTQPFFVT